MTAIAFPIPDDVLAVADGVEAFLRAEVFPRHERDHALLSNPRRTYIEDGRYAPAVVEHIRGVRMAAAKAGYYTMSVPPELGGAGMGMLAYFVVWERIYRLCGSHNWLGAYTVSHWAFGPSPVLLKVTERARAEILAGMMEGRTSMCFGMSEPGAGSDATMIRTRAVQDNFGWRISGRVLARKLFRQSFTAFAARPSVEKRSVLIAIIAIRCKLVSRIGARPTSGSIRDALAGFVPAS